MPESNVPRRYRPSLHAWVSVEVKSGGFDYDAGVDGSEVRRIANFIRMEDDGKCLTVAIQIGQLRTLKWNAAAWARNLSAALFERGNIYHSIWSVVNDNNLPPTSVHIFEK